jgi:hypothetical protein
MKKINLLAKVYSGAIFERVMIGRETKTRKQSKYPRTKKMSLKNKYFRRIFDTLTLTWSPYIYVNLNLYIYNTFYI